MLPAGTGFTGRSAAVLWGVPDIADADDPVEVVLPAGSRWNAGVGVRVRGLLPGQHLVQRGLWRCVSRAATAVYLVCSARSSDRQAPNSWVHQGPPVPSATPTPSLVRSQSRMFARWPGLSSQASITAAASAWPKAMFSARE